MGGHSLGGVMAQGYATKHTDVIKGLILEGSVLLRGSRKVQDDGFTKYSSDLPTMTLCGELDGLLRLTRCVESYWH
jgi:pimeloyl-ACP methyl ester carboxylesterase